MNEPLENLYFNWLCAKVIRLENSTPSLSYDTLLRTLHNTEFVWLITADQNRAEDGVELRIEFLLEADIPDHPEWRKLGCSLLEMLIAFSRRAKFMTDIPADEWFWMFIGNLGLLGCNDASGVTPEEISEVLLRLIWRQYEFNGRGGLFPIERPSHDQTKVEIWYQFCEYLVDQEQ
jgi:hypothetical protein